MNRNIETFKRCLVMQQTLLKVMHRKIVFVNFLLGSQGTVNQTTSCQLTLSKKTSVSHWRGTVVLESKRPIYVSVCLSR